MNRNYHYFSGEMVCVGDKVRVRGRFGTVTEVEIGSTKQALAVGCPDGYVCTVSADGGGGGRLWTPPDGEFWEDLEFVQRSEELK